MPPLLLFGQFALALALAFFFGLAFEDFYGHEARPGGVRTFPLLALAGALLYHLDTTNLVALAVGLAAVSYWLGFFYLRRTNDSNASGGTSAGLIVPVCNMLAFLIGPAALAEPLWVPSGITAAAVLLLTARERLHSVARRIELTELITAGKFLILTGLILPLAPDHPVTTLTTITPRQVWLAVVAVSSVSYASYLLQRLVVQRNANIFVAVLGGLYSSTATTLVLARQLKSGTTDALQSQIGIILATAVMYLRVLVIAAFFDLPLATKLAPIFFALSLLGTTLAGIWHLARGRPVSASHDSHPPTNPLEITSAIAFAAAFVVISLASSFVRTHFGVTGLYGLGALVGIVDVDPFVLNVANGSANGLTTEMAMVAILIATSSNNLLKAAYAATIAKKLGAAPAVGLTILSAAGVITAGWVAGFF